MKRHFIGSNDLARRCVNRAAIRRVCANEWECGRWETLLFSHAAPLTTTCCSVTLQVIELMTQFSRMTALLPPPTDLLQRCQAALDYRFQRLDLLRSALTHASGANTRLSSNERLEFLGDAVLGMVVCEQLFNRYSTFSEGEMTRIKSAVVSRRTCAAISKQLRLSEFLMLGKGMQTDIPDNVLADVFESLIAAIYLDGGYASAQQFILKHLSKEIDTVALSATAENHKSALQQWSQRETGESPTYVLLDEKGPEHSKCFKVAACIGQRHYAAAWGKTKKDAEQKAALNALSALHGEALPYPSD